MSDNDDLKLKAEIDKIMKHVAKIMKDIETLVPAKAEQPGPQED